MRVLVLLLLLAALAWMAGDYDLGTLTDAQARARAGEALGSLLAAFGHPDLTGPFLRRAGSLALITLATAVVGTVLAVAIGLVLGLMASRAVLAAEARGGERALRRGLCGAVRLVQDVLRGVPDFAWALMAIPLVGLGPAAGVVALGLNNGGILGRLYSEIFDTVDERLLEPLRASGAGRLQTFFYGILPAARAGTVSVTLLRWECAVRNSAVIGVVGGGGLGSELFVRLGYGEYDKLLTLLAFLVLLTVGSDFLSQAVRDRVQHDPHRLPGHDDPARERRRLLGLTAGLLALVIGSVALLAPAIPDLFPRGGWQTAGRAFGGLLRPDLSPPALARAASSAVVPLSMAFLATLLAAALAALLAYPASTTFQARAAAFTGERLSRLVKAGRTTALLAARGGALLWRAVPEVLWAMLLVSVFRLGPLPGMLALAVHSTGLLTRLFAERVDAVPARLLEPAYAASGSRAKSFLYGALPAVLPEWLANAFFQFEANVRAAVVLGIVGVGGLGFLFGFEFEFFRFERAATYLLVMVLLAVCIDRLSRVLGLARAASGS